MSAQKVGMLVWQSVKSTAPGVIMEQRWAPLGAGWVGIFGGPSGPYCKVKWG
ncbi:hypothetical protein [Pseudomonas aeruginosa]|jgi:hypothetical protein|uniref:hypothetical protein n=1 Tax=Pseudomonas aeruginosa TaxID=287 RepID=UPI0013ED1F71|nr:MULTISPECIES: hypothetical protein [unclassified Pseudomonas]